MSYKQLYIKAEDLKESLNKVKDYMSNDETRYYLCGVYFEVQDKLKLVATNGHILIVNEPEYNIAEDGKNYNVIVPAKAIKYLIKAIDKDYYEDMVKITYNVDRIEFQFSDFAYSTELVEGTFPDYTLVLPKEESKVLYSFNSKYFNVVAKTYKNMPVSIWATTDVEKRKRSPHVFRSGQDLRTLCVVMPMRDDI